MSDTTFVWRNLADFNPSKIDSLEVWWVAGWNPAKVWHMEVMFLAVLSICFVLWIKYVNLKYDSEGEK